MHAQRMGKGEFVALIAMLFSIVAFSVDAMLPAFPMIEADLGGETAGKAYLIITTFMIGLGLGTFFAGPLSDAIGRKPVMYLGAGLYIGSALVAWLSMSFDVILAARFVQGIAASGPRVVSLAIVRDLFKGREMARITSLALVIFTLVPTLAPALGAFLTDLAGWRTIFLAFAVFGAISTIWLWLRLGESLPQNARKPLRLKTIIANAKEIFQHKVVRLAIVVQAFAMSLIFCLLVMAQPIYEQVFDRADSFPYWFGAIALCAAASTSLLNAWLVVQVGMRPLVTLGLAGQVICSAIALYVEAVHSEYAFPAFVIWQFTVIWLTGLCIGNLNALAMEPMGHIAGFTASATSAIATLFAAAVASVVGSFFDGTPFPLLISLVGLALAGLFFMLRLSHQAEIAIRTGSDLVFRSSRRD